MRSFSSTVYFSDVNCLYYAVFNSNQSFSRTDIISAGQLQPSIVARVTSFLCTKPVTSSEYVILWNKEI